MSSKVAFVNFHAILFTIAEACNERISFLPKCKIQILTRAFTRFPNESQVLIYTVTFKEVLKIKLHDGKL